MTSRVEHIGRTFGILCVLLVANQAGAAVVASDGFDSALNLTSFAQTPTLQTVQDTWAPGDWFGELDPLNPPSNGIPFALTDDSFSVFPGDDQGVIDNSPDSPGFKSDKYFGVVDLENPQFMGQTATATWVFDVSGAGELSSVSIDMGAMGNFEASGSGADRYDWRYKIDDGPELDLFISAVDEDIEATYTLADENGTQVTVPDPLTINGQLVLNGLTTLTADISGSGSTLTLLFESATNGGSEAYAFDNIVVENPVENLGDMDCDGDTDFDDIDDFVLGLNDPATYESLFGVPASLKGDTDGDGDQDFDDIDDFVDILLPGSRSSQVPEPSAWLLILAGALGATWMGRRGLG